MSPCLALCCMFLVSRAGSREIISQAEGFGCFIHTEVSWTAAVILWFLGENSLLAEPVHKYGPVAFGGGGWLGGVPAGAESAMLTSDLT